MGQRSASARKLSGRPCLWTSDVLATDKMHADRPGRMQLKRDAETGPFRKVCLLEPGHKIRMTKCGVGGLYVV